MNLKSLNRFLLFGLALIATISFIGVKALNFSSPQSTEVQITAKYSYVHSDAPVDQPFEVEDKEEQPETEDNETGADGFTDSVFEAAFSISHAESNSSPADQPVISGSQAEYHTPGYVRLRSILI